MFLINKRIRDRVFVKTVSLVLLFITLLILISYILFKNYSIENTFHISRITVRESNEKIDQLFEEIELLTKSLTHYDAIQKDNKQEMGKFFFTSFFKKKIYEIYLLR